MNQQFFSLGRTLLLGFGVALLSQNVAATIVTLYGTTVNYVYDTDKNVDALALFGEPEIQGDEVLWDFEQFLFRAESNAGEGSVSTDATFKFDNVYATNGAALAEIKVTEFGDYNIINGGEAYLDLLLVVINNAQFSENTGFIGCPTCSDSLAYSGHSNGAVTWLAEASVNPSALFTSYPNDPADGVRIQIQNNLTAITSNANETAWIQKKISLVATTQVPLPASAWLFISALGLLRAARLKR